MKCAKRGCTGRIFRVDEADPAGIMIYYICPNSQCPERGREIGHELYRPPDDGQPKEGDADAAT